MDLPKPRPKKTKVPGQSMLDKNREVERAQAQAEALSLLNSPDLPTGKFTVSPIRTETLDEFEAIFQRLRKQKRSLRRYQLAEALLSAMAEEPAVLAEVVKRLR